MIIVFAFMFMFVTFVIVVFLFMLMFVAFVMMVFSTSCRFPIFILVNKVEMIAMTDYITFWCFTHYIFLIKDIAIMIVIVVFAFFFMMMVFISLFMMFSSYYWISFFIFINKMEVVAVTNNVSCFCFTYNIFFIKNIAIFNFFMMFMCYWICSHCCSNCLLRIIFINKMEVIPMAYYISHFVFFYNIIWIENIPIICRANSFRSRSFLFINSICWWSSIYKMVMISVFFQVSIFKYFSHDCFRFVIFNFFRKFFKFCHLSIRNCCFFCLLLILLFWLALCDSASSCTNR